jgi:hypothetical protein
MARSPRVAADGSDHDGGIDDQPHVQISDIARNIAMVSQKLFSTSVALAVLRRGCFGGSRRI